MSSSGQGILGFLEFSLDVANATLWRGTETVPLQPNAFAVLHHLAERPGQLVTKAELLHVVWAETAVTEWVLTTAVKKIRAALDDDPRQPRIIETVHRRGYRFIAATRVETSIPSRQRTARPDSEPAHVPLAGSVVGRQSELAALDGYWRRALAGDRQIVFVVGEAGIGKTTVVDEFLRQSVDAAAALVARGQCIEQRGAAEPYLPMIEALGGVCAAPGGARLVELLRRHAPAWLVQLPGVAEPAECEALEQRLGTSTQHRMLREMAALVAALPTPLVLVLEDLHWSDHATLDLVSTLAQRRDRSRLLLIGTFRPVEVVLSNHPLRATHQDLRARALCEELWLSPLSETAVAEYLEARWPGVTSAPAFVRVLHEHTDGNPLFLVNIGEYLAMNGCVVEASGGWRLRTEPTALTVDTPQGLHQLITTQIDRLDALQRRTLEVGSLVGRRFSAALVAAALAEDVVEIEERLEQLSRTGLMICADGATEWPDGVVAGAYRFNHFLYQRVLRDGVPPARRRQLHERIATRLELAYRGQLAEVSAELAFHFEASRQAERAVPYLEEAAARATRVGANREAATLLEHALAILGPLPPTPERTLRTIRLCLALAPVLGPALGYGDPKVEEVYQRARRLSEECNDPIQLFQSLSLLIGAYIAQAQFGRAQQVAQQLEGLLPSMPLPTFVFAGSLFIGMVKYHAGDLREASELLERAVSLGDVPLPATTVNLYAVAFAYLALASVHQGYPDRGRAHMQEAARRSAASGRPYDRSMVAHIACFTHLFLQDTEGLAAAAAEAAACEDFPAIVAVGRFCHGRVLSARGEHESGLQAMRQAIETYRGAGQKVGLPILLAAVAEAQAAAGDVAASFACVAEARAALDSAGEIRYLAELHRVEGALHAARGERSVAEHCFRHAIDIARKQGERWSELRATISLARLALEGEARQSRRTTRDELASLVTSFSEGFDTPDLLEARRLLERGRS